MFSLQMYDTTTQNPELIWDNKLRANVSQLLTKILNELAQSQLIDLSKKWDTVKNFKKIYGIIVAFFTFLS